MHTSEVAQLLNKLISIPSVNPELISGADNPGEQAIADFVANYLRDVGFHVAQQQVLPNRPNVVAWSGSGSPHQKTIVLVPHLDTVGIGGMTIPPFKPVQEKRRIFGRGACDDKGPMAAMLVAAKHWKTHIKDSENLRLCVIATCGEETGCRGAQALMVSPWPRKLGWKPGNTFFIIGEPTDLNVVIQHKGSAWVTLKTKGQAAHGSRPDLGKNAIVEMLRALDFMEKEFYPRIIEKKHSLLGQSTMNIGQITGGRQANVVPDECETIIDLRLTPDVDLDELVSWANKSFAKFKLNAKLSFTGEYTGMSTKENDWLVQSLSKSMMQQKCGGLVTGAPWFCDGAIFSRKGFSAVAFGPGSIAQAHTDNEYISVEDLEKSASALTQFLMDLSK